MESTITITIDGIKYEESKTGFKTIRDKYNFKSISSTKLLHVWSIEGNQTVSVNYVRVDGILTYGIITWIGSSLTPLLKSLIKLFVD